MKRNWPDRVPRAEQPRLVNISRSNLHSRAFGKFQTSLLLVPTALILVVVFILAGAGDRPVLQDSGIPTNGITSSAQEHSYTLAEYFETAQISRDHSFDFLLSQVMTASPTPTASPAPTASPTPSPYPLVYDAGGVPQEGMPTEDFIADGSTWYTQSSKVNMRQLPNTGSGIVAKLVMGDAVIRLSHGLHWSFVQNDDGLTGYVLTSLMSPQFVARPTPSPTPTPKPTKSPAPTPLPTTAPAAPGSVLTDEQKAQIVELARSCLGVKYVYASESMDGFDCSGLTTYIYQELFGITNLPRSARGQATAGKAVTRDSIEIGDIICFDWSGNDGICDHVGIYIGGGQYIHASYSKGLVLEATLKSSSPVVSIRRIIY